MCCGALVYDRSRGQISDVEREGDRLISFSDFLFFSENVSSTCFWIRLVLCSIFYSCM